MKKSDVKVLIRSDSRYPVNRKKLRAALVEKLMQEKLQRKVEMSVMVVGKRKMKTLNKEYRGLDYATNVLSFTAQELAPSTSGFVFPEDEVLYLGDCVVCYPVARAEAARFHKLVDDQVIELALHSLEHLLGRHH